MRSAPSGTSQTSPAMGTFSDLIAPAWNSNLNKWILSQEPKLMLKLALDVPRCSSPLHSRLR